jgi:diphthine synthase
MAFYLIGTGLGKNTISADALEAVKSADKIYLENYTVNFPYPLPELESELGVKFSELKRSAVEDESILEEAKTKKVALLVYGDALSATTHIQLILSCKKQDIPYQIFHNASIMIAVAETGLQLYKFGKTASMPNWKEHTNKPMSFMNYIKENLSIQAHTLILTDIGLEIKEAIAQLEESSMKTKIKLPKKILAISNAGTRNQQIFYNTPKNIAKKEIKMPFCLIIPSELHFIEEEALEALKKA